MKLNIYKQFVFTGIIALVCFVSGCRLSKDAPAKSEYYVVGNIWPSYYDDPINREIWPEGLGEWEIVKKATPRFEGHYQPKVPLWGYEQCNDPKVMERWIDVALKHGINVFMYDWYWYNEGPFLESALNDGFLKAKNNEKMYFYVMWANHDMPMKTLNRFKYANSDVTWSATVDWKNWQIIVDRMIKQYFHKPNYLKIDGKPVFSIYFLLQFLENFGDEEGCRKALVYFNEEAKKAGFPGVHFQLSGGGYYDKSAELVESLGFNSMAMLTMGGLYGSNGRVQDYLEYGNNAVAVREQYDRALNIPFFPCVSIGYDDTPRFPEQQPVRDNLTPEAFAIFLAKAKKYLDDRPNQPKLIMLNAWNEWAEGCYLLPDEKYGFGYLEAVRDVMNGKYDSKTQVTGKAVYLNEVRLELQKEWPENRTVNLVFHGHSVPSGYFVTPDVRTLQSYPYLTLQTLKEYFPYAVVNTITTAIGGENAEQGCARFGEVLAHRPDVVFIDYALNDVGSIGLERARNAWETMIREALDRRVKVVLMTPTPDLRVDILNPDAPLEKHAAQIRELAAKYETGLVDSYATFKQLKQGGADLNTYMSQDAHPNEKGHRVVCELIAQWFVSDI